MARRILNRRELRDESDAAAARAESQSAPAVKKAPPPKRKSRAKVVKEVRLKAFWAVRNQLMAEVATFEYSQLKEAQARAAELTESKKSPHFVQVVKKVIEE